MADRQPEQLTIVVEISNIVFSAVFAVEMLLKIIAEGPFGYISNGFNVFDGVVVVLRYENTNFHFSDKQKNEFWSKMSLTVNIATFEFLIKCPLHLHQDTFRVWKKQNVKIRVNEQIMFPQREAYIEFLLNIQYTKYIFATKWKF